MSERIIADNNHLAELTSALSPIEGGNVSTEFTESLSREQRFTQLSIDRHIDCLSLIRGHDFTTLADKDKRKVLYDISEADISNLPKNVATEYLDYLLLYYYEQPQGEKSEKAWDNFIRTFKKFDTSHRLHEFHVLFHPPESTRNVFVPHVRITEILRGVSTQENLDFIKLQLDLVHTIGILNQDENWSDLILSNRVIVIRKDNWDEYNEANEKDSNTIYGLIRERDEKNNHFGGVPHLYASIQTKFPDITACISFPNPKQVEDETKPLTDLLDLGLTVPLILLIIPTEQLLSWIPPKKS